MEIYSLTKEDFKLIDEAKKKIIELYEDDKHHVGASLRTSSGNVVSAVHIEAYVGRVTVCAEAIAIGTLISNGEKQFDTIVAVRHPYSDEVNRELKIVSPCGMCRELISDYSPDCFVIINLNEELVKVKIGSLIPLKYSREI
ncbi:cytidine deaminase [Chengkuizengella axinellae]|uniref:Cytidine deaminase n=1 Tax=Chengkuizengella axinellae TaxID=3064388 RepID=A0ABT9IZX0_9BACL|nr:cytidine deaminase [Chengkuizengella sp. 2205SS18-9]MDP5274912.1 cytidine deaminase [Chengkuizengella sp. 2205SS18-9]